jgi:hypothetical protein
MTNLPVACTLSPETLETRKAGLLPGLAREADAREDTADGLRLRFASSATRLQRIAAVVDAERQCCRFLRFDLTVEPDGGPVWLALSGPAGTKEFLAALLDE